MNWETFIGLVGGGLATVIAKFYIDWRTSKREDKKDTVTAWQQIADRESSRITALEERVTVLERSLLEKETYIKRLEKTLYESGLALP